MRPTTRLTRRRLLRTGIHGFLGLGFGTAAGGLIARASEPGPLPKGGSDFELLQKSKAEWRGLLPARSYRVLFEEDTERPWSSGLNDEKREGTFVCAACFLPLFESKAKYDSGTGWPSFWRPITGRVAMKKDFLLIVPRTEYHCARCGGHQGHLFEDGPRPTGQRWCNNGLALKFVPAVDELPELRA